MEGRLMKTKSIGIIDSGLGGYSFYHTLTREFPEVSFVLIADQANAPFGDKSKEELSEIANKLIDRFHKMGISLILIACNTLSASVLKEMRDEFSEVELISIIDLTISQIKDSAKRILVIATTATINQKAYSKALSKSHKNAWINEVATPKLVDLIEGLANDSDIDEVLEEYLSDKSKVDTIVLGCTHYPLIKKNIEKITNANQVDALEGSIEYFNKISELPLGTSKVFTTLDAKRFAHQIKTLFNDDVAVEEIVL